ncbi:DUF6090 family protein [Leptobacterium sp. I13]|uniref:DUF6090 family protein n=1 Tax=Leptobacterium meishanense TaxID=3128904 RepID=UPI0030EB7943
MSWKYAIGEVLLTFIAINLAIAFNNWNEGKKAEKVEQELLKELKENLKRDLTDLDENINGGYTFRIQKRQELIELFSENTLENEKGIKNILGSLFSTTIFITNDAAFHNLKSQGLNIVTNTSLRNAITAYYDTRVEWFKVNEQDYLDYHKQYLLPVLVESLFNENDEIAVLLEKHPHFINHLKWLQFIEKSILAYSQSLKKDIEALILQIDDEIKNK